MEVLGSFNSDLDVLKRIMVYSAVEAVVVETLLVAQRSLACLVVVAGSLQLKIEGILSKLTGTDKRFPLDELSKMKQSYAETKDVSDSDDDNEDDDEGGEQDDDAGDEDFSGEEGGEDDDEGDPEDDPEANGNGASDDEDDNDDGDEDEDGDEEDEEEEEDEDEEEEQPPAKKRK